MSFPKDFIWGTATAAYQIEGAYRENGKGASIWDEFCTRNGAVKNGDTGNESTDHYHRYKEDIAILKRLGIKSYRFSVSWPRILPHGIGEVNKEGLAFYDNLINELIRNDIEPVITIYHWDLPLELQHKGGWLNEEISDWFAEYVKIIAEHFSDRVKKFMTLNEPLCFVVLGYEVGMHAPGLKLSEKEVIKTAHNVLVSHGKAVKTLRKYGRKDIQIGIALCFDNDYPFDESNQCDIEAAKESFFRQESGKCTQWLKKANWWLDPIIKGKYPSVNGEEKLMLPSGYEDDLKIISQPIDFIGFNLYNGNAYTYDENNVPKIVPNKVGYPRTSIGWPITPSSIKWVCKFLYDRYNLPLYITENGMACHDAVSLNGKVHDPNRIDYLDRYLTKVKEAIDDGVDVKGYYVWSFLDNFEWAEGYNERFGIVYVDYQTQERIIKDSGYWYSQFIRRNMEEM